MVRRYSTANNYNIVGFCVEFQEFIRIVRYIPENRLVCVIRFFDSGFWNHPDDINVQNVFSFTSTNRLPYTKGRSMRMI